MKTPWGRRSQRAFALIDGESILASAEPLPPGGFYTEPANESHFARTGSDGATVSITGYGPTDTVYAK